jgi:Pyruvate/2-oxoacid:ferredoxin oxidoreductase delta subunit/flavodoxin
MSIEIYYFTGTGNSLAVARGLAERLEAALLPIAATIERGRVAPEADAVGLVVPVYHKGLPLIVERFAERLATRPDAYRFAVCTYGDTSGLAVARLRELLQARGQALHAGWGVHMPYNYLTPSPVLRGFARSFTLRQVAEDKRQALIAGGRERVEAIAAGINAREKGTYDVGADPLTRLADRLGLDETLGKWVWLKVAGVDEMPDVPFIESRQWMDHGFYSDARCNGCATCARLCPVDNIHMVDERPEWLHRCEQCFACLQWCPHEAIQFGANTAGVPRYHHPDVTLGDMLGQATG